MQDRHLRKVGCALVLAATATVSLVAKQNPQTQRSPIITLNLSAVDSQGQPVRDLRPEDVQVLENGKPQPVVWLRSLSTGTPELRATFILIDLLNDDFQARGLAENEVAQALAKVDSGAHIYLYLLTPEATIFPVHGVAASADTQWTQHAKASLDEALRQVGGLKSGNLLSRIQRTTPTWSALSHFAGQLAQVPGPKSFIWITEGVENGYFIPDHTNQFVEILTPLREFSDALNVLGTAIYTVQQKPSGTLEIESPGSLGDTLNQLSALTGGESFPTDSTSQAITQAISGVQRVNYRLGFSPAKVDGKYHKIHLTSARSGIKIESADRYYGSAADSERHLMARNPGPMLASILSAISLSPFEFPEMGVRATISDSALAIHVDGHDVLFLKKGDRWKAELALDITESGLNGQIKSMGPAPVDLNMSEEEHAKALTEGIDIPQPLTPDGAARPVRVIVFDHNSYLVGTSTVSAARNQPKPASLRN